MWNWERQGAYNGNQISSRGSVTVASLYTACRYVSKTMRGSKKLYECPAGRPAIPYLFPILVYEKQRQRN
jgi:hypothetical protein